MAKGEPRATTHKWEFLPRFRRRAFGWRSELPRKRVKEAVSEIKRVARQDPVLAAEGAVRFLERLSPAIEQVDSSSGSIGSAVNNAIAALTPIIGGAPADAKTRDGWLERLWTAQQEDGIPYLEALGRSWGALCGSPQTASDWADRLREPLVQNWASDPKLRAFFKGTTNCLSALLAAGRHDDLLELLEHETVGMWYCQQYAVKALAAQGKVDEAVRHAEAQRSPYVTESAIARVCEEVLLAAGRPDEAYARFGLEANSASTYLAWFRKVAKKYPAQDKAQILADLVARSPGQEGKWFAAAKSAKLYEEAIALANQSPCDPKTLTRAARDFVDKQPTFALEAGLAALRWLVDGYGYEITNADVIAAYTHTLQAAANADQTQETEERIQALLASEATADRFVSKSLRRLRRS